MIEGTTSHSAGYKCPTCGKPYTTALTCLSCNSVVALKINQQLKAAQSRIAELEESEAKLREALEEFEKVYVMGATLEKMQAVVEAAREYMKSSIQGRTGSYSIAGEAEADRKRLTEALDALKEVAGG